MNSTLNWAVDKTSRELGVDRKLALLIYKSYWKFIRETISDLPLDSMSQEDFRNTTTNFSIPHIGKLYTSKENIEKIKRKQKYIKTHVKVKRD